MRQQEQAQAAAIQQEQEAVAQANSNLTQALNTIAKYGTWVTTNPNYFQSVLNDYARDWAQMQQDWQKEQVAATVQPFTCYQKGNVQYDAGNVNYDFGNIQYDDGTLRYDINGMTPLSEERQGVATIAGLYEQLQAAVAANTSGTPPPAYTQAQVNQAVNAAEARLQAYQDALTKVTNIAKQYDDEGAALNKQAAAFANSLSCSG